MKDYGMAKEHNPKSKEIYEFISKLDFQNGDFFIFKSGGDGDNGECLMDLLDVYFLSKQLKLEVISEMKKLGATQEEIKLLTDETIINAINSERSPSDVAWAIMQ